MNELVYPTNIAGLPTSKANSAFSKNTFKMFIPKFGDFIDRLEGQKETIINLATGGTLITNVATKIVFINDYIREDGNKLVLNIDSNKDIIVGKRTILCYKEGYNTKSEVVLTDTSGLANEITITYLLDNEIVKSEIIKLDPNEEVTEILDFDFGNADLNSVFTIKINDDNNSAVITSFTETVESNFEAAYGDGALLYEAFCGTADQKIIKNIWNVDWEFAMSLCIAHYLALFTKESEVSYGLGDISKDSDPRGLMITQADRVRFEYKNIMLNNNETKFWQNTEFGRQLITLLYTKAIPTMIVVN